MCAGNGQNQTPKAIFESILAEGKDFRSDEVTGVGAFLVPDPEQGILEFKVVYVEGITYAECMKRGNNCTAFQWIAVGVNYTFYENKSAFVSSLDDVKNLDLNCNDECRGGCVFGCMCWSGEVWCHRRN